MPRLMYAPSSSSLAARAAICSRVHAMSVRSFARADSPFLDPLVGGLLRRQGYDALDVDTWQVDVVRRQVAGFDELLDLGDRHPAGHRTERVEIAGGVAEDQVAVPV